MRQKAEIERVRDRGISDKTKILTEKNQGSNEIHLTPSCLIFGCCCVSGDIVTFDNWRLLHGRRSYISRPDRLRHLEGAYLDWDEVMSRLRILRNSVHEDM